MMILVISTAIPSQPTATCALGPFEPQFRFYPPGLKQLAHANALLAIVSHPHDRSCTQPKRAL